MKKLMFNIFVQRLFWKCQIIQGSDGYYYHRWSNWFLGTLYDEDIFAGYYRSGLNRKSTTFKSLINISKETFYIANPKSY